ncbi:MAG: hypothetical protein M9905_19270 [Rhizobiaceae bacterium]|nr:hypothetical protein [Rhizobiaceae bacterium]
MGSISVPIVRTGKRLFLAWRTGFGGMVVGTSQRVLWTIVCPNYAADRLLLMMSGAEQQDCPIRSPTPAATSCGYPRQAAGNSLNLAVATGI